MIGLDGFSKVPNVSAHGDEVLPDLPMFVVTLQGFLQGVEGFVSASNGGRKRQTERKKVLVNKHTKTRDLMYQIH